MKRMTKKTKFLLFLAVGYLAFRLGRYMMTNKEREIDLTARTIWGEARGEGIRGMQAVANVIRNRVKAGSWYGQTYEDVVLKPYQFSCWNENDPNFSKIWTVDESDVQFSNAKGIAKLAYNGDLLDITGGATHYHRAGATPNWAFYMQKTAVIGNHIFYKE